MLNPIPVSQSFIRTQNIQYEKNFISPKKQDKSDKYIIYKAISHSGMSPYHQLWISPQSIYRKPKLYQIVVFASYHHLRSPETIGI